MLIVPALAAALLGVLLGGRASAEDGRAAARTALARGDAAQAVGVDEAVAGRGGFLMVLDPGASTAAQHDAQGARVVWAQQLARAGDVDAAVAVLRQVVQPDLLGTAAQTRTQILVDAAAAAATAGHATLALERLDQASAAHPPASMVQQIASLRAKDEVTAASELVSVSRAPDAVALLDDAAAHGGAAAAAPIYPSTLLAAAQTEIAQQAFADADAALQRIITGFPGSPQAQTAHSLESAPQGVSGTLVDGAGHAVAGQVRLSTHFTQLSGGYLTSGPFYYATTDAGGDFTIGDVPVGGPFVLEYFRSGGWMTLVDPHTDQPANPVTVKALTPQDLTFIVLPG